MSMLPSTGTGRGGEADLFLKHLGAIVLKDIPLFRVGWVRAKERGNLVPRDPQRATLKASLSVFFLKLPYFIH